MLPFLINDSGEPEKERLQSSAERARFDDTTKCILCAACTTSCPIFWGDEGYIGPAAIVNAHRFIFDSRDEAGRERLKILTREDRRLPVPDDVQLHGRLPARHRGHEGDPGSEAHDPVRPLLRDRTGRGPHLVGKVPGPMAHRVTIIPGDGIGPEVAEAARLVLDAADVGIEWIERSAGTSALEEYGELMPEETLDAIRSSRVAIKGPITTPVGTGFRSVNVALRQGLDLFSAVRPARALPGVPIRHPTVDLVVIRENTEDLYAGIEYEMGSPEAIALREELRDLGGYELRRRRWHHGQTDQRQGHPADRAVRVRVRACPRPNQGHGGPQGQRDALLRRPVPEDRRAGIASVP